ncbi:MAG TPA: Hsp20/alpha crystallin family protein [Pseudonocardiaceae bacterium]|jgi:HSP20 family protein|nr:Hsp20/alpha crystallin family protein [Pseudonocardiaceae bacterium]
MAIAVRGTAWYPFTTQLRQFDTGFDTLVRQAFGPVRRPAGFVPAADVAKDGNDVVVTLALPGVDVDSDIDVTVTDGRLAITGRRAEQHESDQNGVLVREIRSGEFRREFTLPRGVTADQVEADYDRGLLKVRVREVVRPTPEPAKVKVRNVAITAGAGTPAVTSGE